VGLGFSFAPPGLVGVSHGYPRLMPWAAFFRRFAAFANQPGSELEWLGLPVLGFRRGSDFPIPASTLVDWCRSIARFITNLM
jgi:hypothetical protein